MYLMFNAGILEKRMFFLSLKKRFTEIKMYSNKHIFEKLRVI